MSATLQGKVGERSAGTKSIKVKIVLEKRCEFGQQFYVVGDDESFGAWNPEASIPMQWSEGHVWTTEMEVLVGKRVEFKVILMGCEKVVDWQPGPNRVLEPLEVSASPVVMETHWGEDEGSVQKYGIDVDIESLTELATSERFSSDMDRREGGLDAPAEESDGFCEQTMVDEDLVEIVSELSETRAFDVASEDAKKDMERRPTVVEKDLQWCREALSMLWGAFTQKGNNKEV